MNNLFENNQAIISPELEMSFIWDKERAKVGKTIESVFRSGGKIELSADGFKLLKAELMPETATDYLNENKESVLSILRLIHLQETAFKADDSAFMMFQIDYARNLMDMLKTVAKESLEKRAIVIFRNTVKEWFSRFFLRQEN